MVVPLNPPAQVDDEPYARWSASPTPVPPCSQGAQHARSDSAPGASTIAVAAVGIWLLAVIAVFASAGAAGAAYDGAFDIPDSDSADGFAVLEEYFPALGAGGQSGTIVFRADQGVDDPEVVAGMEELFAEVGNGFPNEDGVAQHPGATVISPYSPQGQGQVAAQGPLAGRLAYGQVNLAADVDQTESAMIGEAIREAAPDIEGLEVLAGGAALGEFEPPETELIGLAFAVVVLILAFGSVLAMGLPIAVALFGVSAGIGSIVAAQQRCGDPRLRSRRSVR